MKPKYHSRQYLGTIVLAFGTAVLWPSLAASGASDTWDNGVGDNLWQSVTNWVSVTQFPGATSGFASTDDATFSLTGATGTIDLGGTINVRSLLFGESGNDAASFAIGDANDVLNFTTAGGITINAGVTTAQQIGVAGTTINLSTASASTATISNNGTGLLTIAGNIVGNGTGAANTIATSPFMTVQGTGNTTVTGSITRASGAHLSLFKTGAGILTLSNGSNFDGVGAIGYAPATAAGFPLVVRQGTLLLNGGTHTVTGEAVIGGVVTNGGAGQDAKLQVDAGALNISGYLSVGRGNGNGAATSDLTLNNGAKVTAGNFSAGFNAGNGGNLPKGTITLNNSSDLAISGNGVLNLGESAGSNFTMTLNGTSTVTKTGNGLTNIGGIDANNTTPNSGAGTLTINTGTTFTTGGEIRLASNTNSNGTASGTINVAGGTLNALALTLNRNRTNVTSGISSLIEVTNNGTVNVTNGGTLVGWQGGGSTGTINLISGAFNQGTVGTTQMEIGVNGAANGIVNVSGGTMRLQRNSNIRFSSNASSSGTNSLNISGGNVTFYSDAGSTVGGTGVIDMMFTAATATNTLNLNVDGTLTANQIKASSSTGTRVINFNGGTLKSGDSGLAATFLASGVATTANMRNGGAIIDTNGNNVTIGQTLVHSTVGGDNATDGGLTKNNTGTLTLTGPNTFTGVTSVAGGKLLVNGNNSGGGAYNVGASGTLGGTGSVGLSTINVSGVLSPGASVETLSSGTVNFATGSTFAHELNSAVAAATGADLQVVSGDLSLTGLVNLTLADLAASPVAVTPGTIFSLINYSGSWNGGTFTLGGNALADDTTFTAGLNTWQIDYNAATGGLNFAGEYLGGTDSFVNFTAVPEPASILLGGLGLLALLRRRRK